VQKRFANKSCCGQEQDLIGLSKKRMGNKAIKLIYRTQKKGFRETLKFAFSKVKFLINGNEEHSRSKAVAEKKYSTRSHESLNLQPGETVEVRSLEEVLSTLDETGKCKGLRWMPAQQQYCGRRLKVFKRLETMILESTREIRKAKNTVLLEGAICDGEDWYGCDRSCFFFWREAWLKRIGDKTEDEVSQ
jgi:hypothetical protein